MAARHDEFLSRGTRLYGLSADLPGQNAAVMSTLALTFPILSDTDRSAAITPLGFADENDPRQISRPGVVIVDPDGEIVHRVVGRDYADRPDEEELLGAVARLGLDPTSQEAPVMGVAEPGEKAVSLEGMPHYFRGARFATLALRSRHRDLGPEFREDTKAYVGMLDRYLEAIGEVGGRRS